MKKGDKAYVVETSDLHHLELGEEVKIIEVSTCQIAPFKVESKRGFIQIVSKNTVSKNPKTI